MSPECRRAALLGSMNLATLRGLEIGPLCHPIVKKTDGSILYVDHADTEYIKNANNPEYRDQIVDIDIVWGDKPLKDLVPYPLDYAVACHVIEHIPDTLG